MDNTEQDAKKLSELKEKYEQSLITGSVEDAILHGEAYFTHCRNSAMTDEDKEMLQNDILTMNSKKEQ